MSMLTKCSVTTPVTTMSMLITYSVSIPGPPVGKHSKTMLILTSHIVNTPWPHVSKHSKTMLILTSHTVNTPGLPVGKHSKTMLMLTTCSIITPANVVNADNVQCYYTWATLGTVGKHGKTGNINFPSRFILNFEDFCLHLQFYLLTLSCM